MNTLDLDLAKSIRPDQLRRYLLYNQWSEDGCLGEFATIWHRQSEAEYEHEILLPEDIKFRDYLERIVDAIRNLARYEQRTESAVLKEVANYFSDMVSIRVAHPDVDGGTIPFEDGVRLFEKAKELLVSVALSTISKKRHFFGQKPNIATDFISSVKLGQTEIGSYVVNVVVPLSRMHRNELPGTPSFSRIVTSTLSDSLNSLKNVPDDAIDGSPLSLDSLVECGVSVNMCDALIGFSGEHKSRSFDISISYSNVEKHEKESVLKYVFTESDVLKIEKISEYLKNYREYENITINGIVIKLDRASDVEFGTVTVVAVVEDTERAVSFELPASEYHEAVQAHDKKLPVKITGDLHVTPRTTELLNCSGFSLFDNKGTNQLELDLDLGLDLGSEHQGMGAPLTVDRKH